MEPWRNLEKANCPDKRALVLQATDDFVRSSLGDITVFTIYILKVTVGMGCRVGCK